MTLKHFKKEEFDCQETGENEMSSVFLHRLDELRTRCGFPFVIVSGYRSPEHSLERDKLEPGSHAKGLAADVYCPNGASMHKLVREAIKMQFEGIGVNNRSVHLDDMKRPQGPVMWGYGQRSANAEGYGNKTS